ncbi:MAG: hypothetical protein IJ397_01270 [Lachnospiraceae bacterium]|nr:hypothetical protein [Lachnospiraceae bacterium]
MEHFLYSAFLILYVTIMCYWAQLFALTVIIVSTIFLVKNVKRKSKKKIAIFSSLIITTILLVVSFYMIFPTHFPYVDTWIYGKTREEIQAVYGEPDYDENGLSYIVGPHIMENLYYCIEFDRSGRAVEIYETTTPWPGG